MIRMIQSASVAQAKAYFNDGLSRSDYYLDGQELPGRFMGKLAARLDLDAEMCRQAFHALCDNRHPETGMPLTPRTKQARTVGYDVSFHCPKSLSILHTLSKDDHLLDAFTESVRETMRDIETDSKTRIRKKGQDEDRPTGELVWGEFVHQTARPVDGSLPDPHLHAHCFVFNATFDKQENRIKAGQFRDIKRDMPYYQVLFHKRLSDRLIALGYRVRRTDMSFEVDGVPERVIAHFSKRTNEIGQVAKEKGITDAKALDALGARTRAKKQKGLSRAELRDAWKRQIKELDLHPHERQKPVRHARQTATSSLSAAQCIDHALAHGFERASVLQNRRLLAFAYRHALGYGGVSADAITSAFAGDGRILRVKEKDRTLCTTREVLEEETRMVVLARDGVGAIAPLYEAAPGTDLDGEQAEALRHLLTNPDRVSILRGGAGTGKTTLLRELNRCISALGKKMVVVAPTSDASRGVLRSEGFAGAETVTKLFADAELQEGVRDGILLVDEAGLLGTKDMLGLLSLAVSKNARLILSGDERQHGAVVRGDALRLLSTIAGIKPAQVNKIYRQKNADYREAVEHLAAGDAQSAFEKLDAMGAIKEINPERPYDELAEDYLSALKRGKSALVICPPRTRKASA